MFGSKLLLVKTIQYYYLVLLPFLLSVNFSQSVRINELMASNSITITDEDGDYPDWIELYNYGDQPVNLDGMGLSDDLGDPFKWVFSSIVFNPGDYLLVFASDKNRLPFNNHWETIINWGDDWRYVIGYSAPPSNWRENDYTDSYWPQSPSGFGYGDGDDATIIQPVISVFIRKTFDIETLGIIQQAVLHVDFDDAFVAYLNGTEFARSNIGTPGIIPSFNQSADTWREAQIYLGGLPEFYDVENAEALLTEGQNTLAIEVHNFGAESSDMSLIPFFTLGMSEPPDNPSGTPDLLDFQLTSLHTNFKINADGEYVILTSSIGEIVDSLFTGPMPEDISRGRFPDGGENWIYYADPTPGVQNGSDGYVGIVDNPIFSEPAGFYSGSINVSISTSTLGAEIRYTTDGAEPTEISAVYSSQLALNTTTVVRARAFNPDYLSSAIITQTFILNEDSTIPVVSLSTTPENLWDYETGIYVMGPNASSDFPHFGANFWQDWERPIHLELIEPDSQLVYAADAGVKIFGAWSRGLPQKSLALYARDEYGYNNFSYPFFPDLPFDTYEAILLRNSGNDWESSMFRDGMMTSLVNDTGLDVQAYRPVAVYLNGVYWGIHNMREKLNEHYIASHHPVDPDDLDLLENDSIINLGDAVHYNNLINFLQTQDITNPDNYEYVSSQMEIDNFITHQVSQIYFDNQDWPGNNTKYWRPRTVDGRWRWLLYDTDFGFGIWNPNAYMNNTLAFALEPYGPGWPNPPWSTFMLRTLMENPDFRNQFINRFCDLLNTIFDPDYVVPFIDAVKTVIEPEMPNHLNRWYGSMNEWYTRVNVIETFAEQRVGNIRNHLQNEFDLASTGLIILGVAVPNTGKIKINTVIPDSYPWHGYYFQDVDIHLTAQPTPGYYFSGWSGIYGVNPTIIISPANVLSVTAYFEPISTGDGHVVINEINYRSSDELNTEDWIEIHNNGYEAVNISFWQFRDSDDSHVFIIPENTFLDVGNYLVLCQSIGSFSEFFPEVTNAIGDFGFGLSRYGEILRLFNSNGEIVDSLSYSNIDPWPEAPDGNGPTLELIHPDLDNSSSTSWSASIDFGTPGWENSVYAPCQSNGDANLDGLVNVSDIVAIIGYILGNTPLSDIGQCNADIYADGQIDVLDIVAMVDIILDS